jgi:hypothetical protein
MLSARLHKPVSEAERVNVSIGRMVMAIDDWNGTGDWNLSPTDWSLGAPPSSTKDAEIQSGDSTLSTSGWVDILNILSGGN